MSTRFRNIYAVIVAVAAVFLAGCSPHSAPWVIGKNATLSNAEKAEFDQALPVARRYISAWVAKDYKTMYSLQSPHSADSHPGFRAFAKVSSKWRREGVYKSLRLNRPLNANQINESLRVVSKLREPFAKIFLGLTTEPGLDENLINKKRWPEHLLFVRHAIEGKNYMFIMVKDHGQWSVMCAPGVIPIDEMLEHKPSKHS
jgi:hypothetical protein